MTFVLDETTGVLTPTYWRSADWPDFQTATEEQLTAALQETDETRYATGTGHLVVRGLSKSGAVIYRGTVNARLWNIQEVVDASGNPQTSRQAIHHPVIIAVVPREATLVTFEGWLPASHSTFSPDEIAAQYQLRKRQPETGGAEAAVHQTEGFCTSPTLLLGGRINVVVFGDGYRDDATFNDHTLFSTNANAVFQKLFSTSPWSRYTSFFTQNPIFIKSADHGAVHPVCTDHSTLSPDPDEGRTGSRVTAFSASYCSSQTQRLLTVDNNSVQYAVAECVTGYASVVLVSVNDSMYGGSGGEFAVASVHPLSPYFAIHEIGHSFVGLADEYADIAGANPSCSDISGPRPPCVANVTDNTSEATLKWKRWVDGPLQICHANLTCGQVGVGLYEGAFRTPTGMYRPESNCLMRTIPAPNGSAIPLCSVCQDEHIRKFYSVADPWRSVLHEELREPRPPATIPDLHIGNSVQLGAEVLELGSDPDWAFTWRINGQIVAGETGSHYTYTPQTATTARIELEREDKTTLVRFDATHPRPMGMDGKITWLIVSDAAASARSNGAEAVSQTTPLLNVPKGTQTVSLVYTLNTMEPDAPARPGDFWTVDVKYAGGAGGAGSLAAAELPYHKEGIITSVTQNGRFAFPVKVNAADSDVQVVAVVTVKDLETDEFVPTTIEASLTATPVACGADCDYCAAHPSDPACPLNVSIDSAAVRPLPATQPNRGDSSSFSLGERLDDGRLVDMKMTTPANFNTLRVGVTALAWDGTPLMNLRNVTWFASANDYRGGVQGLERDIHDSTHWQLNISPKKDFPDVDILSVTTPPESSWARDIRYHITATVTMPDGRSQSTDYDIDHIVSPSTPAATDARIRPMHALWHSPASNARWHYWSTVAMNAWLRTTTLPLHVPDRIADEYAVDDTPLGHEFGTGVTEVPFYPNATRYDSPRNDAYYRFRATANAALDAAPASGRAAARDTVVAWINATRTHLAAVLADSTIAEVRVGDGGLCGGLPGAGDHLPEAWMKQLLQTGKITDASANVLIDLTSSVGGSWTPPNASRLTYNCLDNDDINILVDRCRIGDLSSVYCGTGRLNIKRTHVVTSPQATAIDAGQAAILSVVAEGSDLHYQWYVGASNSFVAAVPNATGASLTVSPDATTSYWVLVSGALGDDASESAIVTVNGSVDGACNDAPVITGQPVSETIIIPGEGATLIVSAAGENLRYQWYLRDPYGSETVLAGANSSQYIAASQGRYFARVRNACGVVDSGVAWVGIGSSCSGPFVMRVSASKTTVSPGESITLTANVMGLQPMSVVWYQETPDGAWTAIGGGEQISVTPPVDQTSYYVAANNQCGGLIGRQSVSIHICGAPAITVQPVAPHFTGFGQSANVSVTATGSDLHYEWNVNGSSRVNDSPTFQVVAAPAPLYIKVRISNDCGFVDSITITVDPPCDPPVILNQPQGGSIVRGTSVTLTSGAFGTDLLYQWYVKAPGDTAFATIANATSDSIAVSPTVDQTQYKVVIRNNCGTVESNVVTVAVTEPCAAPQLVLGPVSQGIESGGSATLSAGASGSAPMSVQWEVSQPDSPAWVPVSGATSTTVTVTPAENGTLYRAVFTNSCGGATTSPARIDVCVPPSIAVQPQSSTINNGSTATLSVDADLNQSNSPLHYHWYAGLIGDRTAPVGSDAPTFTTPPLTARTFYWVALNAGVCETASQQVTISICTLPAVAATGNTGVHQNENVTLTLSPNPGTFGMSYQWYRGVSGDTSNPIAAANTATTTITATATGSYWCRVTSGTCVVDSSAMTVSVCIPTITTQPVGGAMNGQAPTLVVVADMASTYQWYRGASGDISNPLNGATAASYTPVVGATSLYWVRVSGGCGHTDSVAATVSCVPPSISSDPINRAITRGQTVDLTVGASGTGLTYQWYQGAGTANPFGGATSATLTMTPQASAAYWCRVTGPCGTADSGSAQVDVCSAPTITTQPQSQTINSGQSTTLTVSVQANGLNPTVHYQWYRGTAGDRSAPVGSDSASFTTPALTVTTSYWVAINAGTCETASAQATVSMCALPAVAANGPASIQKGQTITISLSPNPGTLGITYQWYAGASGNTSSPITSATAYAMTIQPQATTSYWCRVTNASCSADSTAATATVCIPQITTQPSGGSVNSGQPWTMHVVSDITATYQWYQGTPGNTGSPVSGQTTASLTISPTITTSYFVRISGSCGYYVDSAAATVSVCVPPSISGNPAGASITRGQPVNLTVAASGTNLTYQWYQGAGTANPYGGATSATLTATPQVPTSYWCRVSGSCGTADSLPAQIDVCATPSISAQPQSQTVADGSSATLSVTASEPTGLPKHYQWYRSTAGVAVNPVGTDSSTYTTGAITAQTSYFVRITSGVCSTDSATATISTCPLPVMQTVGGGSFPRYQTIVLHVTPAPEDVTFTFYEGLVGDTSNFVGGGGIQSTLSISASHNTQYWARVDNGICQVDTAATVVTVY